MAVGIERRAVHTRIAIVVSEPDGQFPQTPRGNAFSFVQRKNGPRLDHRDLMRALDCV
jgi:hypothetical protein